MSAAAFPFDQPERAIAKGARGALAVRGGSALDAIRAVGGLSISARAAEGGTTAIADLHEFGGYRFKCPEPRAPLLEAVMINTGGGVAGGDRISIAAAAEAGSRLALTTATAERIYRTDGPRTEIEIKLAAQDGARLAWLPQATILFSGAALHRRLDVELAAGAQFLAAETTIFGRGASGEEMSAGLLSDQWRVRRDGRLIFAEAARLEGHVAKHLARPAVSAGAPIAALLVCVAPDLEERCEAVRAAIAAHDVTGGVSAWNGLLAARLLGDRLDRVAEALRAAVTALRVLPLPAAWTH